MPLAKFLSRFYTKCFIGIYETREYIHVSVLRLKGNGEREQENRMFSAAALSNELPEYLQERIDTTPFNYIALLSDTEACGALPTCSPSKAREMAPAVAQSRTVCVDEEWMNYLGEEEIYELQQRYSEVAPDAVYTPFALMHAFYSEAMAGEHALFVLLTPEAMSLVVAKEAHLRFAEHFCYRSGPVVPLMVAQIVEVLERYYGKPCCRGEFIESLFIADGAGVGTLLQQALEDVLLLDAVQERIDPAFLTAQTCMKETGYGL